MFSHKYINRVIIRIAEHIFRSFRENAKSRVFDCIFSHHLLRAGRVWKFCEKINDLAFVVLQITVAVAFFCLCREKRKICEEEFMKIAQTTQNDVPTCVRKWETALAAFNYVHMEGGREKSLKFNCQFVVHSFQQMTSLLSRRSSLVQMSGGIWRERKWWILKKLQKFTDRRELQWFLIFFHSICCLHTTRQERHCEEREELKISK